MERRSFDWTVLARWAPIFLVGFVIIGLLLFNQQEQRHFQPDADQEEEVYQQMSHELEAYYQKLDASGMPYELKEWAWERVQECFQDGGIQGRQQLRMIDGLLRIPFGNYSEPLVDAADNRTLVPLYLSTVRKRLDGAIYGQDKAKDELMRVVAQWVARPESHGNTIGLQGPPGIGKTRLVREGVGEALGRPVVVINLGGAKHAELLVGSERVYLGSRWGQIAAGLMQHGVMNPIFYFDELDKVSRSEHGREVIDTLMHLIDPTQNDEFQDRYFAEVQLDLSRALFIFSFNHADWIDPILRDRMKIIDLKGYSSDDKLQIAQQFIWPEVLEEVGLNAEALQLDAEVISWVQDSYTFEPGVRRLREQLSTLAMEINLRRLRDKKFELPFTVSKEFAREVLGSDALELEQIETAPQVGTVTGLFATDFGLGGILKVQVQPAAPQSAPLTITGNLGEQMYESALVAHTVAWGLLDQRQHSKLEERGVESWHIHRSGVSVPVEGPSAGCAVTLAFYSAFTGRALRHDVAITGEIDLQGRVLPIGGLRAKLEGAKKAGARLVLIPEGNVKDLETLKKDLPELLQGDFKVRSIASIDEAVEAFLV